PQQSHRAGEVVAERGGLLVIARGDVRQRAEGLQAGREQALLTLGKASIHLGAQLVQAGADGSEGLGQHTVQGAVVGRASFRKSAPDLPKGRSEERRVGKECRSRW